MLNIRHLVYPTPCDPNIHPQSDGLIMLREGLNDEDRFFYYAHLPKQHINNRTSDQFNHTRSTGGYNNDGTTIYQNHKVGPVSKGGIIPFPPKQQQQYVGNEISNNPVPVLNALVDWKLNREINNLIDHPLPPQINPMAVPAPKPDPDISFIKLLNPTEYHKY